MVRGRELTEYQRKRKARRPADGRTDGQTDKQRKQTPRQTDIQAVRETGQTYKQTIR